jgi:Ca-activated chloride channel family protein
MSFGSPYLLLLLLGVPLVALVFRSVDKRRRELAATWSNPALLPNLEIPPPGRRGYIPFALFLVGLTFLVVGFARPKRDVVNTESTAPTVVLAFDVSGSMDAADVPPTRLRAAREVALQFLHKLPSDDRISVLTFGDTVRVLVPPTTDRTLVASRLPTSITPKAATSLGDGITAGVAEVIEAAGRTVPPPGYPGLVVVLSDGQQTSGGTTTASAANTAFVERVPVDTVTVGTAQGTVTQSLQVDGFDTRVRLAAPADPGAMQQVAQVAGGTAYTVASPAEADAVGSKLASTKLGLTASTEKQHRVQELSVVLGAAALVLMVAGFVVSGLWFGRVA